MFHKTNLLILSLCSLIIFFAFSVSTLYAQETATSNRVTTRVGQPVGPAPGGGCPEILSWDQQIVNSLTQGHWGYYNRLRTAITHPETGYTTRTWASTGEGDLYWCTYSVVDSYRLAGMGGLTKAEHAAVINMRNWWRGQGTALGYRYIPYSQGNAAALQQVQPGHAIFWLANDNAHTGAEHVAVIKDIYISPDGNGNGYIDTYESNSSSVEKRYQFSNWNLPLNAGRPVRGFGAPPCGG